jgi:hypothetical protein
MKLWQKIKEFKERLDAYRGIVEFNDKGFELKWDGWPLRKPFCQQKACWDNVLKIDVCMWDAFYGHSVGLLFDDGTLKKSKKKLICVDEDRKGYEEFVKYVCERFSGFNEHNVQELEKCCPSDICFPCWDKNKTLEDLEVRRSERIVVWKKDGNVFVKMRIRKQK